MSTARRPSVLGAFRRFWWAGLLALAAGVALGAALAFVPKTEYEATSTVLVRPSEALGGNIQGVRFVLPSLGAQVLTSDAYRAVQQSLPPSLASSRWTVDLATDESALVLRFTAKSTDEHVVIPVANGFADRAVGSSETDPLVVLSSLEQATVVESTAGTRNGLLALGTALGLVLAPLVVLAMAAARPRVRSGDDLRSLGLSVLGEIPRRSGGRSRAAGFAGRGPDDRLEHYERLRVGVEAESARESGRRTLAVVSVNASEGVTSTVADLGWSLASLGTPVTVVDANLRDPTLHRAFQIPGGAGLAGSPHPAQPLLLPALPNLGVVATGRADGNPTRAIAEGLPRLLDVLAEARRMIVLVDTPRSPPPPRPSWWARYAGGCSWWCARAGIRRPRCSAG